MNSSIAMICGTGGLKSPSCMRNLSRCMSNMVQDKSSGVAGSIRSAGGAFAERESAIENVYFHKLESEQLGKLKAHLHSEIGHHETAIARHLEAIAKHKARVAQITQATTTNSRKD